MSHKGPFIVFRVIGFLLLVALIVGGGAMAYRAGVARGIMQAPAVAAAIEKAAENGQAAPIPPMMYGGHPYGYDYGYGYSPMYNRHPGFFNPIGAIIFLFLFFGFMKMMFFRGMMWGGYGHHRHGPPWMRNHNCEENKEGEKKDESPEEKK